MRWIQHDVNHCSFGLVHNDNTIPYVTVLSVVDLASQAFSGPKKVGGVRA